MTDHHSISPRPHACMFGIVRCGGGLGDRLTHRTRLTRCNLRAHARQILLVWSPQIRDIPGSGHTPIQIFQGLVEYPFLLVPVPLPYVCSGSIFFRKCEIARWRPSRALRYRAQRRRDRLHDGLVLIPFAGGLSAPPSWMCRSSMTWSTCLSRCGPRRFVALT